MIDNVTVKQGAAVDYNKSAWSKVEVDSETDMDSTTEGLFEYAFDGNSGTIWHSNWNGASDKLKPQGTFDEIGGVIDLGQKYTINQFKFTPRSGTNSGQVTKQICMSRQMKAMIGSRSLRMQSSLTTQQQRHSTLTSRKFSMYGLWRKNLTTAG